MNFDSYTNLISDESLSSGSVNSNVNSNEVYNITSIIECFENGSFYKAPGKRFGSLFGVNIKRELENTLTRLDNGLIPCVLFDAKDFHQQELRECFQQIRLITQKFSNLCRFLKGCKQKRFQRNYDFMCNTCGQVITQQSVALSDTWCHLQQHGHFAHLFASEDLLNNKLSINNIFADVSLTMTEVPKPNSENGSTPTNVSEQSLSENMKSITTESSVPKDNIIPLESSLKREINCSNCGLQTNSLPNFKFNFEIMYDPMIEKKMFRDNFAYLDDTDELLGQPFLQFKGKQIFTCLICCCDVPSFSGYSIIQQHINGSRHIKNKSNSSIIQALFAYHQHWKQQEPKYQAHQTFFLPSNESSTLCVPCGRNGMIVPYDFLVAHINSDQHKDSFFKGYGKPKGKRNFNCILKLQGEVYADKEEIDCILQDDLEENGYEKGEEEKFEREETRKEKKPQENLNKHLPAIKTKEVHGGGNDTLIGLDKAGCSEDRKTSHVHTASNSKHESDPHDLESDITDAKLNLRRTLTKSAVDKADAALQNETQSEVPVVKKQQNHVIFKAVANASGTQLQDLLEHRFLPHLKWFAVSSTHTVKCQVCKVTMSRHHKVVREHICSTEHKTNAKIKEPAYQCYCEICNVFVRESRRWNDHMNQQKHVERCERLGASRKNKLTEYECETCKLVIFGDDLSIKRHLATAARGGRIRKVKEIILSSEVKTLFKSQEQIQDRSLVLVREANKVLLNQDPVQKCCRALEAALAELYPNCRAYPFGSRVSGLGNQNSDLDLFMDMGDMYNGQQKQDARNQEKFVINACRLFRKKKDDFSHVNPIPTARTPIVQVYHIVSKMDCDLSFRHGLSVENTKFLRLCIDLQPVTQSLILLLKQWVEYCKLQEHITTYALSMMVIFHLQVGGYLMAVHELRQLNPDNVLVIDGWGVVDFSSSITDLRNHTVPYHGPVAKMLKGFFSYYSKFNYATDVVCPLLGRPVKKNLFLDKPNGEELPLEMLAYVKKLSAADAEYFRARSPLCIQDPFDLSHNLLKACGPVVVDKFKTFCDLTFKHLTPICQ